MQSAEENNQFLTKNTCKSKPNPSLSFKLKKSKHKSAAFQQNLDDHKEDKENLEDPLISLEHPKQTDKQTKTIHKQIKEKNPKNNDDEEVSSRSARYCGTEFQKPAAKPINKIFGSLEDFLNFFSKRSPAILGFAKDFQKIEESNNIDGLNETICPQIKKGLGEEFEKLEMAKPKKSGKLSLIQEKIQAKIKQKNEDMILSFQERFESFEDFFAQVLKAYTMDTFLFRILNQYLRDRKWDDMDNLLPYTFCLCKAFLRTKVNQPETTDILTLYRGTVLDKASISHFNMETLKNFSWNAVTSTSRNIKVIEKFMVDADQEKKFRVIFVILAPQHSSRLLDVGRYSVYPQEEEVLLPPGSIFELEKIAKDEKGTINITIRLKNDIKSLAHDEPMMSGAMQSVMMTDREVKIAYHEGEELSQAIKDISGNTLMKEVEFSLCTFDEASLIELVKVLPTLKGAKKFKFTSCRRKYKGQISDDILAEAIDFSSLKIEICETHHFYRIFGTPKHWASLQILDINFTNFEKVKNQDLKILAWQSLQYLRSLKTLSLGFSSCFSITKKGIKDLASLGLRFLTELRSLSLDFSYCYRITDAAIKYLCSQGLRFLTELTSLSLNLTVCYKISMKGISHLLNLPLHQLKSQDLAFCWHQKLTEEEVKSVFSEELQHLKTNFTISHQEPSAHLPYKFNCRRALDESDLLKNLESQIVPAQKEPETKRVGRLIKKLLRMDTFASEKKEESIVDKVPKGAVPLFNLHYSVPSDPSFLETKKNASNKATLHLTSLDLNFSDIPGLTVKNIHEIFTERLGKFSQLKVLSLNFSHCSKMKDILISQLSSQGLSHLSQLTSLNLNFSDCKKVTDKEIHSLCSEGIKNLSQLTSLNLLIEECSALTDKTITNLCSQARKSLKGLTSFSLSLKKCSKITDEGIRDLCYEGLQNFIQLASLDLNFSHLSKIEDEEISALCIGGLKNLTQLKSLSLNFSHCSRITNEMLDYLSSQGLPLLLRLTHLKLHFVDCAKVAAEGVNSLFSKGLNHLTDLISLDLDFSSCSKYSHKEINSICLKRFSKLTFLSLNFSFWKEITEGLIIYVRISNILNY